MPCNISPRRRAMSQLRLNALREELLRAASPAMSAAISELRQHYADLVSEEEANGITGGAAALAASAAGQPCRTDRCHAGQTRASLRGRTLPLGCIRHRAALTLAILWSRLYGGSMVVPDACPSSRWLCAGLAEIVRCRLGLGDDVCLSHRHRCRFLLFRRASCQYRLDRIRYDADRCFRHEVTSATVWSTIPHHSAISLGFGGTARSLSFRMYVNIGLAVVTVALQCALTRRQAVAEV